MPGNGIAEPNASLSDQSARRNPDPKTRPLHIAVVHEIWQTTGAGWPFMRFPPTQQSSRHRRILLGPLPRPLAIMGLMHDESRRRVCPPQRILIWAHGSCFSRSSSLEGELLIPLRGAPLRAGEARTSLPYPKTQVRLNERLLGARGCQLERDFNWKRMTLQ